jgi:predicted urease superfamily metal-dependent hydrolase
LILQGEVRALGEVGTPRRPSNNKVEACSSIIKDLACVLDCGN